MAVKVQVRTEAETKALERYQHEIDEARKKLLLAGKSVEEFAKETRKLDSQQRTLNKLTGETTQSTSKLKDAFAGFTITAGDVWNALKSVAREAWSWAEAGAEAQRATDTLRFAVERAGISWGANADAIDANIQKVSYLAAVDDEELAVAQSKLIRSTGDLEQSQRLLGLATDISAVTGKDLEAVTKALGQAYNGNYGALKKLGVTIGDVSDSTEAMEILYQQFGGAAAYVNDNLASDAQRLEIAWGNLKEAAGQTFGPALSENLGNTALGMNLLNNTTMDGGEKWKVYFSLFGKGKEEQNALLESALGLTTGMDKMSSSAFRAAQAQRDLTAAQQEFTNLSAGVEQSSINLARAENAVEDANRRVADALATKGAQSREYEDALLDARQAQLNLTEAEAAHNDNQATLDALQREIDQLNNLAAAADVAQRRYGSLGYTGHVKNIMGMASGGILPSTPGGVPVIAAEAGVAEAFIPLERTRNSQALAAEVAARVGVSSGTTVDLRGATFGAGLTKPQVQAWIIEALNSTVRSSNALRRA